MPCRCIADAPLANHEFGFFDMPQTFQGETKTTSATIAIVVSRYNESVTGRLLSGALETLAKNGVGDKQITVVWVPGAFEIPVVAARLADSERLCRRDLPGGRHSWRDDARSAHQPGG